MTTDIKILTLLSSPSVLYQCREDGARFCDGRPTYYPTVAGRGVIIPIFFGIGITFTSRKSNRIGIRIVGIVP